MKKLLFLLAIPLLLTGCFGKLANRWAYADASKKFKIGMDISELKSLGGDRIKIYCSTAEKSIYHWGSNYFYFNSTGKMTSFIEAGPFKGPTACE
jgi:hypothetical protein